MCRSIWLLYICVLRQSALKVKLQVSKSTGYKNICSILLADAFDLYTCQHSTSHFFNALDIRLCFPIIVYLSQKLDIVIVAKA